MIQIIPNYHPIFVHFTVALFSISSFLFIVAFFFKEKPYAETIVKSAYINLWLGFAITIITASAGLYAYYTVNHDFQSHLVMTEHRNWAIATFLIFACIFALSLRNFIKNNHYSKIFLLVIILGNGFLLKTAYEGGELVYRYGVGVMSLPKHNDRHSNGGHNHHNNKEHHEGHHSH